MIWQIQIGVYEARFIIKALRRYAEIMEFGYDRRIPGEDWEEGGPEGDGSPLYSEELTAVADHLEEWITP